MTMTDQQTQSKSKFQLILAERLLFLDGGFGTQLQARGLAPGEIPEDWNLSHPEAVQAVHAAYYAETVS